LGPAAIDTAGRLNLPQLGWLVSQLDKFLGNDSGLMHVAAAFKIPSVVLFGASEPKWALPQTGTFRAIQHPEVFCVPCLRNECVRLGTGYKECQAKITVEEVFSAL
jgi:heptosyltransferase II